MSEPPELMVGAGDIAACSQSNDEKTAKLLDEIPGTVFTIGDNAYESGTLSEFTNCYQPTWGRHKARTKPAPGNHEYDSPNAAGYYAYFGAAAGDPAKGYYSFNLGAWHVIMLNSSGGGAGTNVSMNASSEQMQWLRADLDANRTLCTLAIWHHPLYQSTSGSGSGGLIDTKSRAVWDTLYSRGADVVLAGHRHFYERMAPQRPDRTPDPAYGIRQFIVATGGNGHSGSSNVSPNSEVRNSSVYGVIKFWLYSDSYAWKFVPIAGQTFSDSGSTACHPAPAGSELAISPSLSTVTASPTSITSGSGNATITVTVRNTSGAPLAGVNVVLTASGTGNTITQPGPTDANGVATGTLSSTVAQTKTVSATANAVGITQTAAVTVEPGPVSAAQSTIAAAPPAVVAGGAASTITVTAQDADGNPISGATVVLTASGSGNTLTQPTGPTNASGVASGTLASTIIETKTVSATVNGTALDATASVTVSSAPVSAAQSTLAASPSAITAGSGSSTITVTVKDAQGSPISGAAVVLAASGSGNTLIQPTETSDANGVASGSFTSTVAEAKTVSATANGITITQTVAIAVAPGPVSAEQSTVEASPTSIIMGSGTSTITVTAKDANGNSISGASVVLTATGSGNTLTQPGPTGANGIATGTLRSSAAGTKTVTATINGVGATQTATVEVTTGPPSATLSTVTASPTTLSAAGGTSTITVTVVDAQGNPISGATVVLAVTGSGNSLTQPGLTDASGVATGALSSTVVGTRTVSATVNGIAITQTATVSVVPGPVSAAQSSVAAAPASIPAGSGRSTITVTARDAVGNPISGATVVLAATGSGNALTQPAPTNASGVATGLLSSEVMEVKTISATVDGTPITQTAAVSVTAPLTTVVIATAANIASCGGNVRDEATATLLDAISGSVIVAGNGAFPDGAAASYNNCYQPSWGRHKPRTYPAAGNQDYDTPGAGGYFGYFGAAAGDPTKGYYSFDLGQWRIIVLNTGNASAVPYAAGSAQELWLKAELAANPQLCTLAVVFNTRFFSSTTPGWVSSGAAKALWNDLYAAGADVVLAGRMYHYERMAPQDGNGVRNDALGIRQFNVGMGGYTTTLPTVIAPNSEVVSADFGVLKLTLAPDSYSWDFVPIPGSSFTDSGSGTCH